MKVVIEKSWYSLSTFTLHKLINLTEIQKLEVLPNKQTSINEYHYANDVSFSNA